jgi:hypothetical protein
MTPVAQGGVPPSGLDFNGILNWITQHTAWVNGGGQYTFDATLAAFIGGYPVGAVLQSNDGLSSYINVLAGNANDFNTNPAQIGVSWMPYGGASVSPMGVTTVDVTAGDVTLTNDQAAKQTIVVTGTPGTTRFVNFPSNTREWLVINSTSSAINCKGGGAGYAQIIASQVNTIAYNGSTMVFAQSQTSTPAQGDNSTLIPNTAFVQSAVQGQYKSASFNASSTGGVYNINTTAAAITVNLPDPPGSQCYIKLRDIAGYCGINPVTINPGTKTILGATGSLVLDVAGEALDLWYNGSDWRLI